MIATDNHVGFLERDPVRGPDSFAALEGRSGRVGERGGYALEERNVLLALFSPSLFPCFFTHLSIKTLVLL